MGELFYMSKISEDILESFRNNGYYVFEIPPYQEQSYAIVPKEELDHPDDFDMNKMGIYDGFVIQPL